ncbi:hypothetical protein ACFL34_05750, partial [Candidatus Sumerlaeota bacterium]
MKLLPIQIVAAFGAIAVAIPLAGRASAPAGSGAPVSIAEAEQSMAAAIWASRDAAAPYRPLTI